MLEFDDGWFKDERRADAAKTRKKGRTLSDKERAVADATFESSQDVTMLHELSHSLGTEDGGLDLRDGKTMRDLFEDAYLVEELLKPVDGEGAFIKSYLDELGQEHKAGKHPKHM